MNFNKSVLIQPLVVWMFVRRRFSDNGCWSDEVFVLILTIIIISFICLMNYAILTNFFIKIPLSLW